MTSCQSNQTLCTPDAGAAYCASTQTDNQNCGSCGVACTGRSSCVTGMCSCVSITPAACNGVDDNCNGIIDEGCPTTVTLSTAAASSTSSLFGDSGGSAWGPDVCPTGQALIGITGYHGGNLDQYRGLCGTLSIFEDHTTDPYTYTVHTAAGATLPAHGSNVTTGFTVMCPANQIVTRMDGYYDLAANGVGATQGVHQLTVWCSVVSATGSPTHYNLVAAPPTNAGTVATTYNLSESTAFSFACTGDSLIAGEEGRAGAWNDALQFQCYTPALAMRP
jgi:hypothetical protein